MVNGLLKKKSFKKSIFYFFVCCVLGVMSGQNVFAKTDLDVGNTTIKENQVVEINKSLKNVIEENQKLSEANQKLQAEVDQAKNDHRSAQSETEKLKQDRDQLAESVRKTKDSNRQYLHEMKQMEEDYRQLQQVNEEYSDKLNSMEARSAKSDEEEGDEMLLASSTTNEDVKNREMKTMDLLTRIDAFNEADVKLKADAAKAHYNMGNIYFEKGEYEIAAREYYQAVTLMPDDPDAHYNLALVSGEYLNDIKTALKHYQMYLYLNPQAKDMDFVKEKIAHAQMLLDGKVNSRLEDKKKK